MQTANPRPITSERLLSESPTRGLPGSGRASDYAASLLASLGARVERLAGAEAPHPACDWARSGAMALSGPEAGPPRLAPAPVASCMRGAALALAALSDAPAFAALDAPALLGERAAAFRLERHGAVSAGGHCRLLRGADGWLAVNLARPDDHALLPAWLGGDGGGGKSWEFVAAQLAKLCCEEAIERARLLGLPVSRPGEMLDRGGDWIRVEAAGARLQRPPETRPLVVDLTTLWAGPLCTQLLALGGARVLKVESTRRPDGARAGEAAFFDLLNADKASVAFDFGTASGRSALAALIERADLVVESSRPRALAQLGVDAAAWVAGSPGRTWLSITGHGRAEPFGNWVAFGDDAAVAAGLALPPETRADSPQFCGDAIADPIAGLHAALAAVAAWRAGGGGLLDVSLSGVAAHVCAQADPGDARDATVRASADGFEVVAASQVAAVAAPRTRVAALRAPALGRDTRAVCGEFALPC